MILLQLYTTIFGRYFLNKSYFVSLLWVTIHRYLGIFVKQVFPEGVPFFSDAYKNKH